MVVCVRLCVYGWRERGREQRQIDRQIDEDGDRNTGFRPKGRWIPREVRAKAVT